MNVECPVGFDGTVDDSETQRLPGCPPYGEAQSTPWSEDSMGFAEDRLGILEMHHAEIYGDGIEIVIREG